MQRTPQPRTRIPWRWLRRLAQLVCLVGFLVLFRLTEYRGQDEPGEPLNLLFRLDPLTAFSAMLGTASWLWIAWPALIVLALTALFGRFFCGWVCPLGTVLDGCHRLARVGRGRRQKAKGERLNEGSGFGVQGSGAADSGQQAAGSEDVGFQSSDFTLQTSPSSLRRFRPLRFILLILVLLFAALGLPLVGYVDPFALLYRAMTFALDPWLGQWGSGLLGRVDQPWAESLRSTLLPFDSKHYALAGVALGMLGAILLAELIARRFWCRYLCPLGAMLGLVGRLSPLVRLPVGVCRNCPASANCGESCRMDAFGEADKLKADGCTLCMDCVADCPRGTARFVWRRPRPATPPVDLSRRATLATLGAGIALPLAARAAGVSGHTAGPHLLRPPGASRDDAQFTSACVRCGLCLKICPTNALQPARLEAGIEGILSPVLTPRIGYCEVGCTLCGQVCPTAAIPVLSREQKESTIIGRAMIDRTRCLPWAQGEECICCEEHCPVYDKAIVFRDEQVERADGTKVTVQVPFVRHRHCIGCGICENKCPLDGESAIRVVREEFSEHQGPGDGRGRGGGGPRRRRRQGD